MDGRQRRWWFAAGAVVLVGACLLTWSGRPGDSPVYEKAAIRLMRGEMIYRPDDPPAFTYPPFFALVYMPLLALPAEARLFAWNALNLSLLLTIVTVVVQLIAPWVIERGGVTRGRIAIACMIVTVLGARFLISPIEYRSHDYWVLLAVLLSARAVGGGRDGAAGLWAGLATAMKATPLLLLPVLVWQRRIRASVVMVATIALATWIPDVMFPSRDGRSWSVAWVDSFVSKVRPGVAPDAAGAWSGWNALNQSLSGTLHRLFTEVPTAKHQWDISLVHLDAGQVQMLVLGVQLLVLAQIAWAARHRVPHGAPQTGFWVLGQFSMVLIGMLLLSPMSSKQHFCALVPGLAFLTAYVVWQSPTAPAVAAMGIVFAVGTLGAKDIVGSAVRTQLQAYGSVTLCALSCLVAICWLVGLRQPRQQAGGLDIRIRARRPAFQAAARSADAGSAVAASATEPRPALAPHSWAARTKTQLRQSQ